MVFKGYLMAENKPSDLKVVLTWQELLHETSTFFKTYLLPPVLEESEPPTFPHTQLPLP